MIRVPRALVLLCCCAGALALAGCGSDPKCGDGSPEGEQLCVKAPVCGNGKVEGTEACDDGNQTDGDGCEHDCTLTPTPGQVCGNGVKEGTEACDDGNQTNGDGCENDCTLTPTPGQTCGNGAQEGTEECDDGNQTNGDGCENDCTLPVCGNGIVDATEACDDGNKTPGDGCENDCTLTTENVVTCTGYDPTPPATGTCTVTAGTSGHLVTGIVLTPGTVYQGGQVLYDDAGQITCTGCDCAANAGAATATRISCPLGVISPGLINLHDHITYQDGPVPPPSDERYEHRNDWRTGANNHTIIHYSGSSSTATAVQWMELRQVMGGTTSIAGAGGAPGLLRNLDVSNKALQEGLNANYADSDTFPLGDSNGTELDNSCAYGSAPSQPPVGAYLPHIGEGIGSAARNEILCEDGIGEGKGAVDVINANTAILHGVGVLAADVARISVDGAGLVWSPRSNISLYGDTAPVTEYYNAGVPIALGTDWLLSGSLNLLRELRCADGLDQGYFNHAIPDRYLWKMVTSNPAQLIHLESQIGELAPGKEADLAIFRAPTTPGASVYRAVIDANPQDVVLTVRGGKVLYGDSDLVTALSADPCDSMGDVCGTAKSACLSETGKSFSDLSAANATKYGLVFCGTPTNEPTCTPSRSASWVKKGSTAYTGVSDGTDSDGDGIPDANDNCPGVFNPIRPMDHGKQADNDGDGVGDACDACPLDATHSAAGSTCAALDPNDIDGDGKVDAEDNCPNFPNPDQADSDSDGIGDVCDVCPVSNPGNSACPVTIYDLKTPDAHGVHTYEGVKVTLHNVLVTATIATGFFVQVEEHEPGYVSADHSGLYVYTGGAPSVTAGDRVDIASGVLQNYYGQEELAQVKATDISVVSSGNALPEPILATTAELGDGGGRAEALESVLVKVENAQVTDVAPAPGGGDSSSPYEFVVEGALRVDDEIYALSPAAQLNEIFTSITGIHDFSHDHFRIEPRSAADIVAGPPIIASFGPQLVYARVGDGEGPTFPEALTVSIARAQATDTTITISGGANLSIANGGAIVIPAGQLSAEVDVTGLNPDAGVSLTATVGTSTQTATVVVLPAGNTADLVGLTPANTSVPAGQVATFTVTLASPPAADTTVTLALDPVAFGTLPNTVTVLRNQTSATFDLTVDGAATGAATVTATIGATSLVANVHVSSTAALSITELNPSVTGGKDIVELTSMQGGSIGGYKLLYLNGANGSTSNTIVTFPNLVVSAGDVLLVHLNTANNCTESASKTDCSASANAADAYVDGAWDFAATDSIQTSGLAASPRVLALTDPDGNIVEGVAYANSSTASGNFPGWVNMLQSAGVWDPTPCSDVASCKDLAVSIVGVGTGVSSSIKRGDTALPGLKSQWSAPGTSNFGVYP